MEGLKKNGEIIPIHAFQNNLEKERKRSWNF